MPWRTLYDLYNGIIGKTLIIISLSTPIALLSRSGINIASYYYSLIGAIIIGVSFILVSIYTPMLIKTYKHSHKYADKLIEINNNGALDITSEFKALIDGVNEYKKKVDPFYFEYLQIKSESIEKTLEGCDDRLAIRSFSLMKYDFANNKHAPARWLLSVSLFVGCTFLYLPLILNAKTILMQGA